MPTTGWIRPAGLLAVLAAAAAAPALIDVPDTDTLRATVQAWGWLGAVGFVLLYAALTLAPVPKNLLSVAAGLVFGVVPGVLLVLVAAMLGAVTAFWLGRVLGRDAVHRLTGRRLDRLDALLERRGVTAMVVVRLIPVVPFTAVNYGSGLTRIRWRDYATGTLIGIVPGTVVFVVLGRYVPAPSSWQFSAALTALALLTLAGAYVARRSPAPPGSDPDPQED